jgi:hypothetical protein
LTMHATCMFSVIPQKPLYRMQFSLDMHAATAAEAASLADVSTTSCYFFYSRNIYLLEKS